jgi:PBP1b-binding outer membrane lipoprotein LpoB
MKNKNNIIILILVVIGIFFLVGCIQQTQPQIPASAEHNEAYSQFCQQDSDCVIEVELTPQCSHYCQDEECKDDLRLCKA